MLVMLDVPTRFAQAPDDVPARPYRFADRDSAVNWERQANPAASKRLVELIADPGAGGSTTSTG